MIDHPRRQCQGKTPWLNRGDALLYKHKLHHKTHPYGGRVQIYHCPHCGYWHLGTKRTRKQLAARARQTRQAVPRG